MEESTKGQILTATLQLIGEKGFPNLTIREIAERAGVNVAVRIWPLVLSSMFETYI